MDAASALRRMIDEPGIVVLPGAYDALSARLVEQAGSVGIMVGGFGLSASALGMPDLGLLTMTEALDRVRHIVNAVSIPVLADMDTGYGNPANVVRTVQECVRMGVAAVILEDQTWPKRCGHMEGKSVIPLDEHVAKLRAAVHARGDSGLVIVGRTDARGPLGLEDAIARGRAYGDAGADVIFIEAPESIDEMETICREIDTPLLANMIEGGKTPFIPAAALEEMGFSIAIYALSGLFAAVSAVRSVTEQINAAGTSAGYEEMVSFREFEEVIGLEDYRELERRFRVDGGGRPPLDPDDGVDGFGYPLRPCAGSGAGI